MSIILIHHHDENIYTISDTSPADPHYSRKPPCFRSRFASTPGYNHPTKPHATMGVAQECPPNPSDFLKKRAGKSLNSNHGFERIAPEKRPPKKKDKSGPTKEEIAAYNEARAAAARNPKNFVVNNIKSVLKMKTKEPEPKVVIEHHGTRKLLAELEPVYYKSPLFAKTPNYLKRFISENERIHQEKKDASEAEQPKCRYITRDQREKMLFGLKHNWEELQKVYQGLPILTDTIPKKMRKSKIEAELKQLEKDIVLVERHPHIYVYDDDSKTNSE